MSRARKAPESYWDLLADVARLQREMGKDLVAWSEAYAAAGRAFERTGGTLGLMAEVGQRTERYLQTGPPAAVRQTLQLVANPLQALGAAPGAGAADPFARFWELWTSALTPGEPTAGAARGPTADPQQEP